MSANGVDPWQKAAECEVALRSAIDPKQHEILVYLQRLWITLANDVPFLTSEELAKEIEAVAQIQAEIYTDMNGKAPGLPH
jgi:hypothetical protein